MANYLINMNDGRLVFRNAETDIQVNLKPVSDEIVAMIVNKEVTAMDVVNAISAKIKENGDFNLQDYIDGLKKLNVRQSNPQLAPKKEEMKDRSEEEISVSEVKSAKAKTSSSDEKKARAKKANEAVDRSVDDVFKM